MSVVFQDRWEVVYAELRERILSAEIPPGSKIHEVEIAERYGVSRGPVREAIRELQLVGLVIRSPRRSAYVAPATASDVDDVFTLRSAIEALAVRQSVTRGRPEFTDLLRRRAELADSVVADETSNRDIVAADLDFVSTFYDAAGNRHLSAAWAGIVAPLTGLLRLGLRRDDPDWRAGWMGRGKIVDAVESGNAEGAVQLMGERIDAGRRELLIYVSR